MSSKNVCVFVGKLGGDIELKASSGGVKFANAGLAVSDSRKDAGGEWQNETTWVDLTFFGKNAENAANVLHKGDTVSVTASYSKKQYEKDGKKQYSHGFIVGEWSRLAKSTKTDEDTSTDEVEQDSEEKPF